MIKNIIFDLDGVLFDGCEFHENTFIQAVSMNLPDFVLSKEYHNTYLNGLSTKKKLEMLHFNKEISDKIYKTKQELTNDTIDYYIRPDKKIKEICDVLTKKGYILFCVSNSIRSTIIRCLTGMEIIYYFNGIISNEDTQEPKPSPQPYLTLYKKYNLIANECLILEDSPHGRESAVKSGGNLLPIINCNDVTLEKILNEIGI